MRVPTPPPYVPPQSTPVSPFAGMRVPTPPPYVPPQSTPVSPFAGMRVPTPPLYVPLSSSVKPSSIFAGMRVPTPPPFVPHQSMAPTSMPTPLTGPRVATDVPTKPTRFAGVRVPTPPLFHPQTGDQGSALQRKQLSSEWSSLISDAKRFGKCV